MCKTVTMKMHCKICEDSWTLGKEPNPRPAEHEALTDTKLTRGL
jgi:hypothetical protein